jgi:hypothetical protein
MRSREEPLVSELTYDGLVRNQKEQSKSRGLVSFNAMQGAETIERWTQPLGWTDLQLDLGESRGGAHSRSAFELE